MTDDASLFDAWRGGDRTAGQTLIARHVDSLERFFAAKVTAHAEDLVQRTLLACAEATTSYRGEGSFRAFLFGVARNVLYEHYRAKARDGAGSGGGVVDFNQSSLMDLAPGVSTIAIKRAEQRVLFAALRELPMDLQLLLELHYWEEMGVDELAGQFKIPAGTVKSRMHRARGLLAEIIPRVSATPQERETAREVLKGWRQREGE